ncbi:MAG TPA: SRPBCC family protein [Bacteroidales bacterium]|nr:SRPBCC family protein [Bacteroidales bacterium]
MKIEKRTEISRTQAVVFDYLKFTRNQDKFSVWNMSDPNMKKSYKGTDGSVGFIYAWDSTNKNTGAGEQEITALEENRSIDYEIRFFRPMKNTATATFVIEKAGEGKSSVTWTFNSHNRFPMSLFAPLFKKMLGKDLEKGLANLKSILETSK